jgi:transposase InsO family protein
MQSQPDGSIRPIAYASRTLLKHEKNYSAFLLEMLAATYAVEHFDLLLRGRPFTLYTDHKPLQPVPQAQTKTLNRLQLKLLEHKFDVRYIPGKSLNPADFLSRTAGLGCAPIAETPASWASLQAADPECQALRKAILRQADFPPHTHLSRYMTIQNDVVGILLPPRRNFAEKRSFRIYPPASMRPHLIQEAHNSCLAGHGGTFRTAERLRQLYYWPNFDSDISNHIRRCDTCNRAASTHPPPRPSHPLPVPTAPNARIHVDLFGPIKGSDSTKKYVCTITDALTKIVRLTILPNKSAASVASSLLDWVAIYGVPHRLISDNGREFINEAVDGLLKALGTHHSRTAPFRPQTNSQAEVFNRVMQNYLKKIIIDNVLSTTNWESFIIPLQIAHNTAVNRITKTSPFYAMFGYDPALPIWTMPPGEPDPVLPSDLPDPIDRLHQTQNFIRQTARHNIAQEHKTRPQATTPPRTLPLVGDLVYVRIRSPPLC